MDTLLQRLEFRVSMIYFIIATIWILLTDNALSLGFADIPPLFSTISVLKASAFVMVTTASLFLILRVEVRKRDQIESALRHDVAERTRILGALQKSEDRFEMIFHGSPVATNISRFADAHIVDANNAFLALFGYLREEMIGHTSVELGLWDNLEQRTTALSNLREYGSVHNMELQGRTKSGGLIYLLASSRLIELGNEQHLVNMFYNVTEQRKLEEQVQYQALLLANVSDAVISTDTDFNIQSWNPAAETIYGWTAAEALGKSITALLQGDYPDVTRAEVLAQFQTTGGWRGQTMHQRKDGSRIYLLASTSYVYDKTGHHIGMVSVNRDITYLMKAQKEKEEAAELRIQVQKQAELVRLKESFISIVSHEFRTPLTVIMASAELMLNYFEKMPPERRIKHLNVVLEQTRFMAGLLEDVLTINKARAGRLEFNPVPIDLAAFCQETLERIRGVDNNTHKFVFTRQGDLSSVNVDVKLLQHILVNLLSNAVKYSPNGGEILLDVVHEGNEVVLRVSDHGIGIPSESLPQLYDPFFRAKNTGTIGGTGLGMAIVKESVDLHKGTIRYDSELGVGTTATVRLPIT